MCLSKKNILKPCCSQLCFSLESFVLIEKSREKIFQNCFINTGWHQYASVYSIIYSIECVYIYIVYMYTVIYTSISKREGRLVVFLVVVWLRTGNLKISGYVIASMTLGKSDKTSHYSRTVTMLWVSWGYWNGSFTMLYMCVCVCCFVESIKRRNDESKI